MNSEDFTRKYLPGEGLPEVIDLALELGMPLLVTGEPGTGKTRLANFVAEKLGLKDGPLIFNTKTDSQARDLFYAYDTIRHFRESGITDNRKEALDYVSFEALGKALIDSGDRRSVVLIDEIDKAPRDFPNDLLFEIDNLAFRVKEATAEESRTRLGDKVDEQGFVRLQKEENRPVIIITSNSEKNLPDAFMRRVLYHHIEFPGPERLKEIVRANVAPVNGKGLDEQIVEEGITHFVDIRDQKRLRKKPATAELLAWIHVLNKEEIGLSEALKATADPEVKHKVKNTYALLAKNKEDLATLIRDLGL